MFPSHDRDMPASAIIKLTLKDADGNLIWFNGTKTIGATKVGAANTFAIQGGATSVTFVDGEAEVTVLYGGTWAEGDTGTLTVTGGTIGGVTVSNFTFVATAVA